VNALRQKDRAKNLSNNSEDLSLEMNVAVTEVVFHEPKGNGLRIEGLSTFMSHMRVVPIWPTFSIDGI
jgi:hypothetical protein